MILIVFAGPIKRLWQSSKNSQSYVAAKAVVISVNTTDERFRNDAIIGNANMPRVKRANKTPKLEQIYVNLGAAIAKHRVACNMTQETLAEKIALSRSGIGNVEQGRHRLSLIDVVRVAEALGISPNKLLRQALAKPNEDP